MDEDYEVNNGTFFVLEDGEYKKISGDIRGIHIEDELSHRPDLISTPQSFEFSGEFDFRSSLVNYIRLFGLRYGIKIWLQAKFRKKR